MNLRIPLRTRPFATVLAPALAAVIAMGATARAQQSSFLTDHGRPAVQNHGPAGGGVDSGPHGWEPFPEFPSAYPARNRAGGVWHNGNFFLIGGELPGGGQANQIEVFDSQSGTWSVFPAQLPIPVSNVSDSCVLFNNQIWVFGGFTGPPLNGQPVQQIQIIDPFAQTVQIAPFNLPVASFAHATAVDPGRGLVYITGGHDLFGPVQQFFSFDGNNFQPRNNNFFPDGWASGCYDPGMDRFFVGPGVNDEHQVQSYDPVGDQWAQEAPTLLPRGGGGLVCHQGLLYAFGGGWVNYEPTQEIYEIQSGVWSLFTADGPMQVGRRTMAYAADEPQPGVFVIAAVGGWNGNALDHAEANLGWTPLPRFFLDPPYGEAPGTPVTSGIGIGEGMFPYPSTEEPRRRRSDASDDFPELPEDKASGAEEEPQFEYGAGSADEDGNPGGDHPVPIDPTRYEVPISVEENDEPASKDKARTHKHSGEFLFEESDLWIPGRGLDFEWSRSYRSQVGPSTEQGNCWDFSYNIFIEPAGDHLILHDGRGRSDLYLLQSDGSWQAEQFFVVGAQDLGTGAFIFTFPNALEWHFHPLDGSPAEGKIDAIVDRNDNTLQFQYGASGELVQVLDTLHNATSSRAIDIGYNQDGLIDSVTDWTGRQFTYEYYEDGDAGGSAGDLKSVTTPTVVGTPNNNDFPNGKTTTYTYTKGFADEQLNHNLLTITDPKGQTWLVNTYAATQDPFALEYDRIEQTQLGDIGDVIDYVYVPVAPSTQNNFAVLTVIENDREGKVSEYSFGPENTMVQRLDFTGLANPDQPTTDTINRPTGKLRSSDPDFFETRWEYNQDGLGTRIVYPNGNEQQYVYEPDLNPGAHRTTHANVRQVLCLPGAAGGDQNSILEEYEYLSNFGGGGCGSNFVTSYTDGRGNATNYSYDAKGNCTQVQYPVANSVVNRDYNAFGQVIRITFPSNGTSREVHELRYFVETDGYSNGYLEQLARDPAGLNLVESYQYDDLGRRIRVVDPRGANTDYDFNALDQNVRITAREVEANGPRYLLDTFYDANDNVVRIDTQNVDAENQLVASNPWFTTIFEYEILDQMVRECQESGSHDVTRNPAKLDCSGLPEAEFVTFEYDWSPNRNLIETRFGEAVNGGQSSNVEQRLYDERDLVFQIVRAPGHADQSSTQYDYDENRNVVLVTEGLEGTPRATSYTYDGFDRLWSAGGDAVVDPMGNSYEFHYDAAHNLVSERLDGELVDVGGGAGNVRLFESTYTYDGLDRRTVSVVQHFDSTQAPIGDGASTTTTDYAPNSLVLTVTNDNAHTVRYSYDSVNRLAVETDAAGNTVEYSYDENSNLDTRVDTDISDLGAPDQEFTTRYSYDGMDRLIREVDNVGNTFDYAYDSRNNLGLELDARRNGPSLPGNRTEYTYDGINRLVSTRLILTGDGTGTGGTVGEILTTQEWDDSSRLIARADGEGNTTRYAYDGLDRLIVTRMEDGTLHQVGAGAVWTAGTSTPDLGGFTSGYDPHDNAIRRLDANGSAIVSTYDLLERLTRNDVTPGAGVSNDTTFEAYQYDGLSRLVRATDDDSSVDRSYDSLSNIVDETQQGPGGTPRSLSYTYDGVGRVLTSEYPGTGPGTGRRLTYSYDALDRLQTVRDTQGVIATYDYVGPNRVERREYGNGTRTDYTYDGITGVPNPNNDFGVKRLIGLTHSRIQGGVILDDRTFTWDPNGNKSSQADVRSGGSQWNHRYRYDSADRLVRSRITAPGRLQQGVSYALDDVGNRLSPGNPSASYVGPSVPGHGPERYRLKARAPEPADRQVNQFTYTPWDGRAYDLNGNLTGLRQRSPSHRNRVVEYDYCNRMVEHDDRSNNLVTQYAYDAIGRRIQRTEDVGGSPTVTRYYYDEWQVCEEQDGNDAPTATYVYGSYIDEVLNMQRNGQDFYYHCDDLHSARGLSDASGSIVERYEYGDFGEPLDANTRGAFGSSNFDNSYLFTGRRYDEETRWYYSRARYLDPIAGRFTTRDPIGTWGDPLNRGGATLYVGHNPQSYLDPTGRNGIVEGLKKCAKKVGMQGLKRRGEISYAYVIVRGSVALYRAGKRTALVRKVIQSGKKHGQFKQYGLGGSTIYRYQIGRLNSTWCILRLWEQKKVGGKTKWVNQRDLIVKCSLFNVDWNK